MGFAFCRQSAFLSGAVAVLQQTCHRCGPLCCNLLLHVLLVSLRVPPSVCSAVLHGDKRLKSIVMVKLRQHPCAWRSAAGWTAHIGIALSQSTMRQVQGVPRARCVQKRNDTTACNALDTAMHIQHVVSIPPCLGPCTEGL